LRNITHPGKHWSLDSKKSESKKSLILEGVPPLATSGSHPPQPVLFVVATPIGNLDDMTPRAIATLKNVDIIAAEDTRTTRKLLSHFNISGAELVSYHDHVEEERSRQLIDRMLRHGLSVALVSDAGTPCVADPGYRLVRLAKEHHIKVHPIPGASALTSLISASGLPSDRVLFVGFLPTKTSDLRRDVQSWAKSNAAIVYFEPTRRLEASLAVIAEIYPNAEVAIGRELTKLYEEIETKPVKEALSWLTGHSVLKGEAVVMVHMGQPSDDGEEIQQELLIKQARAAAVRGFSSGKTLKDLLKELGGLGLSRAELYQLLLAVKDEL
jgi:16S rRNA (cytidine1402-2'-O)-methyltransferase